MYDVKSKKMHADYSEMTCKVKSEAQSILCKTQEELNLNYL